jgi:hypothetical protein
MWKSNWNSTEEHFINWWNQKGVMVGMWGGIPTDKSIHINVPAPKESKNSFKYYINPEFKAAWDHFSLSQQEYPLDIIPIADTFIGPGSLALYLGCEAKFTDDTIWIDPSFNGQDDYKKKLLLDEDNKWFSITKNTIAECKKLSDGKYFIGCPDLVENLDILASLRGAQDLMIDMLDMSDEVMEKIWEINDAWFKAYNEIYELIKLADGSSCYGVFRLWGPGKTVKVQCDASAMISTQMFRDFVVPPLKAQCDALDNVLYHLDGTAAIKHLDAILEIDSIKAIEWTPEAGLERGGDIRWFDMYKRIIESGKSLQAVEVKHEEILPLIDALGDCGLYILCEFNNMQEAEKVSNIIEKYL